MSYKFIGPKVGFMELRLYFREYTIVDKATVYMQWMRQRLDWKYPCTADGALLQGPWKEWV